MNEEFAIKLKTVLDEGSVGLVKQQLLAMKNEIVESISEATSAASSAKDGIGITPEDLVNVNQYSARIAYIIAQINDLTEQVRLIDMGQAEGDVLKLEARIEQLREQLAKLIGESKEGTVVITKTTVTIKNNLKDAVKSASRFVMALIGVRSIYSGIRKAMSTYLSQNEELQAKLNGCWYALGSLFAPALEWLVNKFVYLVSLVDALARSLGFAGINMSKYGKATGKAAKESKQLAGFDELNNLNEQSSGGGGGGGSGMNLDPISDEALQKFKTIATLVAGIAAGLAAWKIATTFMDALGWTMGQCVALGLAVAGVTVFVLAFADAWKNGINWSNLTLMIGGVTVAMLALSLAFSPVIGGIVGIVGGIALLVLGIREFIQTGEMTKPVFAAISAGCLLIGAGIALITGSWIPMIIGAIAGILIPGLLENKDKVVEIFNNIKEKIAEFIEKARTLLQGARASLWDAITALGDKIKSKASDIRNTVSNLLNNIKSSVSSFFSNLGTTISTKFRSIINSYIINPINRLIGWLNEKLHFNFNGLSVLGQQVIPAFDVRLVNLSSIPMLDVGTNYVPNDMLAQIHKGEAVLPKAFNEDQFANTEETNELLRVLIEAVESKNFDVSLDGRSLTRTVTRYQHDMARELGGA